MPSLYVVTSDGQISNFPISKDKVTIGRSKDNDLVLTDNTISRHHAEISRIKKGYFLSDLGSYNKTEVNGKSIESIFLNHGDKIQIGMTKLSFLEDTTTPDKAGDSLIITGDTDHETEEQRIVQSSHLEEVHGESRELLVDDVLTPRSVVASEADLLGRLGIRQRKHTHAGRMGDMTLHAVRTDMMRIELLKLRRIRKGP